MMIGKTTIAMAARRGIALEIWPAKDGETWPTLEFCHLDEDGEAADEFDAAYWIMPTGLFYLGTCLSSGPLEDVPQWIASEGALRGLLGEFSRQMALIF